ncbi:3'(2'),5'-bisphosphate nucleotidase CysQ family protein [Suttonella ornithocola]|uniref:3'(2'),5-bisphosphonucleoside 3'(2')-phosphohydrolase n=1 Tax=Suttonella ornithocola TaxID=279832 RepID=A0A380MQI6_9GAMM|nr:3'(2'),5'-bisphosphate nucleotidase CysQ [Suttonella ornithocola]SUO94845.1 3'(2'),5'-bisphosphate nucleotidase CysQ [Suttonella ornithocola]
MLLPDTRHCIEKIAALCEQASAAILYFYGNDERLKTIKKADSTPLTQADLAVHKILMEGLPQILSIPVVSEESAKAAQFAHHRDYWLIDPIDGTKEFINRTGEFCIAIARIENHRPTLGLIYAPLTHQYWFAIKGQGAYRYTPNQSIKALNAQNETAEPILITAKPKIGKRLQHYLSQTLGNYRQVSCASALKFCWIAEGKADIYFKLASATSEWDTAAGDILLSEVGGGLRYLGNTVLQYGRRETTLNPPFIAYNNKISSDKLACYFEQLEKLCSTENIYLPK